MKMPELAPIVLFVYNRPWHTEETLKALEANHLSGDSLLYIYSDGPKEGMTVQQLEEIENVRKIIRKQNWCKEVIIKESTSNKGLAESVILGVTEVVSRHGKVIVLEDDIITSNYFLTYLNEGLELYASSPSVYSINSYVFPIKTEHIGTFLSPLATSSWGWATWKDRWSIFERVPQHKALIQNNPLITSRFNFADYDYASMLNNANSWAIRWYYSVFLRNGLGLFPTRTLSFNIGAGPQATNTKTSFSQQELYNKKIELVRLDKIDLEMHLKLAELFVKPTAKVPLMKKVIKKLKALKRR